MEFGEPTKRVLHLPAYPESAGAARRWISSMDVPLNDERAEQLRFLANELVTNSIRHAAGKSICVEVDVLPGSVRVSITDDGDAGAKPTLLRPSIWNTSGRGLALVDRLSSRWGHSTAQGTVVWFEMDREDASLQGRLVDR